MAGSLVHVAVGVIVDAAGNILIAKRPDHVHQGGLWEFPGGKLERGESLFAGLKRELFEELAIEIREIEPLIKIGHDYGDKRVLLDVHRVTQFSGVARGNEGQAILWVAPERLGHYDFPAANRAIITALQLPERMLITGAFNSVDDLLSRLERALARGIRLVQLRMADPDLQLHVLPSVAELCQSYSARLMLNATPDIFARGCQAAPSLNLGLHLNSVNLLRCTARPVQSTTLLGASCHNLRELEQAQSIGVDFVCLSPVLATGSHPGHKALGWEQFARWVEKTPLPVFALGGMGEGDLLKARQLGAQGLAAIGAWWPV